MRNIYLLVCLSIALGLGACGGKDGAESNSATGASSDVTDEVTTGSEVVEQDGARADQPDFYSERYISAEERLQRRQNRIEQQLSGGDVSGSN